MKSSVCYAFYFTTTANACGVFLLLFFYETEGTCDCIYVFSDFISFGPKLQVYNIIYMALYSL